MEEIEYEVTKNSSVDGDELDRYAVYRLLLLSFEKDVRSGDMEFDELIDIEKVAADICRPFIRLSSLDLRLSVNGEMWRKPPAPKKRYVRPLSVFRERKVEKGFCPVCGKRLPVDGKGKGRQRIYCSGRCRTVANREKSKTKRNCVVCGKEFWTYGKKFVKYCSSECYVQARFYSASPIPYDALHGPSGILYLLKKLDADDSLSDKDFRYTVKILISELEEMVKPLDQIRMAEDDGKEE